MRTRRRIHVWEQDELEVGPRVAIALLVEECEAQAAKWGPILEHAREVGRLRKKAGL